MNKIVKCLKDHWIGGVLGILYSVSLSQFYGFPQIYKILSLPLVAVQMFVSSIFPSTGGPFFTSLLGIVLMFVLLYVIGAATQWLIQGRK